MDVLLELLSPERIAAFGTIAMSLGGAWMARQNSRLKQLESKVTELEAGRAADRGIIRACARYIRAQGVHIALLCGLLRQHAPHVEIPDEPPMPQVLEEEV